MFHESRMLITIGQGIGSRGQGGAVTLLGFGLT